MKKQRNTVLSAGVLATALLSTTVLAAQVPNFTDHVNVDLKNFPAQVLKMQYHSDNDVNISGDTSATVAMGVGVFKFSISSANVADDGYPTMAMYIPSFGGTCQFHFVDGPWTNLAYNTAGNQPPSCAHLKISGLEQTDQYQYRITVTYQ